MLPSLPEAPRQGQRSDGVGNIFRGEPECESRVMGMAQSDELGSRLICRDSGFEQTERATGTTYMQNNTNPCTLRDANGDLAKLTVASIDHPPIPSITACHEYCGFS